MQHKAGRRCMVVVVVVVVMAVVVVAVIVVVGAGVLAAVGCYEYEGAGPGRLGARTLTPARWHSLLPAAPACPTRCLRSCGP